MLSLDEPLDLKLPRGCVSEKDHDSRSPPLIHSPPLTKRARQLRMTDDGTAVIILSSSASPQRGESFMHVMVSSNSNNCSLHRYSPTNTYKTTISVCTCVLSTFRWRCCGPPGETWPSTPPSCWPQCVTLFPTDILFSWIDQWKESISCLHCECQSDTYIYTFRNTQTQTRKYLHKASPKQKKQVITLTCFYAHFAKSHCLSSSPHRYPHLLLLCDYTFSLNAIATKE